jgi:hypothetical protein
MAEAWKSDSNKRTGDSRRSGAERRSGIDTRSDEDKRTMGERRKGDRRSGADRRAQQASGTKSSFERPSQRAAFVFCASTDFHMGTKNE